MTRPISIFSLIALTLIGCGTAPATDTSSDGSSGGVYAPLSGDDGSSSSGSDDTDTDAEDTDSGTGDDTDTTGDGGTTDCSVTALLGIIPDTEWDAVETSPATTNPQFNLWNVANDTMGDYDGYGVASGSFTSSNAYITVEFSYCPGDVLVVGGDFFDGYRDRWLAEANGMVNIFADPENDDAKRVVIDFGDGNWQGYRIGGSTPDMGAAGWVDNGDGGGDLFVATFADVDTHDDSL